GASRSPAAPAQGPRRAAPAAPPGGALSRSGARSGWQERSVRRRARAQGVHLGRPRVVIDVLRSKPLLAEGKSLRQVAKALHVALATLARAIQGPQQATTA